MKTRYEVTYGYTAVISVSVKATTEEEAKKLADAQIQKIRGAVSKHADLQDDTWTMGGDGIVNMTQTWDLL